MLRYRSLSRGKTLESRQKPRRAAVVGKRVVPPPAMSDLHTEQHREGELVRRVFERTSRVTS